MPDRRTVTVGRCDYGPTMLWRSPTDGEQGEFERKIAGVLDGSIPTSSGTGWKPSDRPFDPRGGVGREISDGLWESLVSWASEWVENGGDWAESDPDWLQRGAALADAVRAELGAKYEVVYGYQAELRFVEG